MGGFPARPWTRDGEIPAGLSRTRAGCVPVVNQPVSGTSDQVLHVASLGRTTRVLEVYKSDTDARVWYYHQVVCVLFVRMLPGAIHKMTGGGGLFVCVGEGGGGG